MRNWWKWKGKHRRRKQDTKLSLVENRVHNIYNRESVMQLNLRGIYCVRKTPQPATTKSVFPLTTTAKGPCETNIVLALLSVNRIHVLYFKPSTRKQKLLQLVISVSQKINYYSLGENVCSFGEEKADRGTCIVKVMNFKRCIQYGGENFIFYFFQLDVFAMYVFKEFFTINIPLLLFYLQVSFSRELWIPIFSQIRLYFTISIWHFEIYSALVTSDSRNIFITKFLSNVNIFSSLISETFYFLFQIRNHHL